MRARETHSSGNFTPLQRVSTEALSDELMHVVALRLAMCAGVTKALFSLVKPLCGAI